MPCTGACCVAFPISAHDVSTVRTNMAIEDGDLIGFMLRPLTFNQVQARDEQFGVSVQRDPEKSFYRCIYWDEETRRCGAYKERPEMCRSYPYGKDCGHGCDCKDGAQATRPAR